MTFSVWSISNEYGFRYSPSYVKEYLTISGTYTPGNLLIVGSDGGLIQGTVSSSSSAIQSGYIPAASFTGTPLYATVSIPTAYSNTNYSVNFSSEDIRVWSVSNKTINSFRIESNSSTALSTNLYWSTY